MSTKDKTILSDEKLVEGILSNDEQIIRYFFFRVCTPLFDYIIKNIFNDNVEKDELINEFYLYLRENEWYKVRQFNYRSKLTTWTQVVAIRFFQKKRNRMIEKQNETTLYMKEGYDPQEKVISRMDIERMLSEMSNKRYQEIIYSLFIEDTAPKELAEKLGITVDNLYNMKRRAMWQLAQLIGKEGRNV
ncbi:MAG: sigma-70 family RNA polymerase sigma factor [Candidatus Azobacteroides sp.]|nr:sigma-70 family RNA polymerase sigma factor [Candidatus Azobacteroides sp.]